MLPLPIVFLAIENEQDREKAAGLFRVYYSTMKGAAFSILKEHALAEDAVSEAFVKIIRNLHKISDISCYQTRGFVVIIVENIAKTMLKKRNGRKENGGDELDMIPDDDISGFDRLTIDEGMEHIVAAILSLPEKLSDVLYLSAVHEKTNAEIAETLGISKDVVKMRLSRAKKAVRQILGGGKDGKSQ